MTPHRRLALVAGILYLVTFATSIPALALKAPLLEGAADDPGARVAIVLELLLALSCVGTAVALYPVTRSVSEPLALGFVASRLVEASFVAVGAVALVALLRAPSDALVAVHDAAFLLGPGILPAVNALLLGTALLRGHLVPRVIPIVGLVGAPLLVTSALGSLFGAFDQVSGIAGVAALPIALWEFSIGVWLIAKGVREPVGAA
jgi:hypothetical protein